MDWGVVAGAFPRLLPAFGLTIQISLISLALAMVVGIGLGTAAAFCRRGHPFRRLLDAYVFLVRGTPILVQILAAFFLLPVIGVQVSPVVVGIVALTFNSGGYQIEIARAAVESIDRGQREAARALGLGNVATMQLVVVPQAFRRMIPPLTNELSHLVKASSVLSVIAVFELHRAASAIAAATFHFIEMLFVQAVLYLILIQGLTFVAARLERRYDRAAKPTAAIQLR